MIQTVFIVLVALFAMSIPATDAAPFNVQLQSHYQSRSAKVQNGEPDTSTLFIDKLMSVTARKSNEKESDDSFLRSALSILRTLLTLMTKLSMTDDSVAEGLKQLLPHFMKAEMGDASEKKRLLPQALKFFSTYFSFLKVLISSMIRL